MKKFRFGYVRVSTVDQNTARQLDGIEVDRKFVDKASGSTADRPALKEMLAFLRDGDTVVVHSMDRLARNLSDLLRIVQGLTDRGIKIEFLHERLTFAGDDDSMSRLLLSVMGAVAEFERSMILERQREGIELAKRRGVYRGRKPALSDQQVQEVRARVAAGESKASVARQLRVSRDTVRSALSAEYPHRKA